MNRDTIRKRKFGHRFLPELLRKQEQKCFWCNREIAWIPNFANKRTTVKIDHAKIVYVKNNKRVTVLCATLDHVVPLSKGGTRELSNLVAACGDCNNARNWAQQKVDHYDQAPLEELATLDDEERAALIAGLRDVAAGRVVPLNQLRLKYRNEGLCR